MSNPSAEIPASKIFDVRYIYSNRHQKIFERFNALEVGDYFVLRNGHDPGPLRAQFEQFVPGAFAWDYLEPTSEYVQVKITKLKPATASVAARDCSCAH